MQDKIELIIHPARMRIVQYAANHGCVTVAQIAKALPDISKATLYRHVRVLSENEVLQVVGQEKIRGTYEQSYSLNLEKIKPTGNETKAEMQSLVYFMLANLIESFREYFVTETSNPIQDKLFASTNTFYLDDSQFDAFIQEIYAPVEKYLQAPAQINGKSRMITIVSSPAMQEESKEE